MRLAIEVASLHKKVPRVAAISLALMLALPSCKAMQTGYASPAPEPTAYTVPVQTDEVVYSSEPDPTEAPDPWTEDDVYYMALTLSGECYDDEPEDKRKVCEVILNRISDGRFGGDTVYEVVSCDYPCIQFSGYWQQSRPISENDREIAEQALRDWYANGCEALSEWLYFSAGPNHKNIFR